MAAIFRKSLRLTHESRKKFTYGKLMNMIATDANALGVRFLHKLAMQVFSLWHRVLSNSGANSAIALLFFFGQIVL